MTVEPATALPPAPWRAAFGLLRPALIMLVLLALVLAALAGTGLWLLRSEAGTQWLLPRLPGVEATGLRGALLSDRFEADQLVLRWDRSRQSATFSRLRLQGMQWTWRPDDQAWAGLVATSLVADLLQVDTGPPAPLPRPDSLALPLRLQVPTVRLGRLQVNRWPAIEALSAGIELGAGQGREHRVQALQFDIDRLQVQARGRIAVLRPFALQVEARAQSRSGTTHAADRSPGLSAQAEAAGVLERFDVVGSLRAPAPARGEAPTADLKATVLPYATWPLAGLSGSTRALDLSALTRKAPRTRLTGSVDISSSAMSAPVGAWIRLENGLPGPWNEGLLPVRRAEVRARASIDQPDHGEVQAFDLQLGDASSAAGRWQGRGSWQGRRVRLETVLEQLAPQRLDPRAAAMVVSGPVDLDLDGLPTVRAQGPQESPRLTLNAQLDGRLDAQPVPVRLGLQLSVDERRLELRQLTAQAGGAQASASALASRAPQGDWELRSEGSLSEFDPRPWWPGDAASAWRQGSHRFSGQWSLDLRLPRPAPGVHLLTLAQGVSGRGTVKLVESRLAGIPLAMDLRLARRMGADSGPASALQGELSMGGNRLWLEAQGDPMGSGEQDRAQLHLQAPRLDTLAPLAGLWTPLQEWAPLSGSVQADITLAGRWPAMHTEGRAQTRALRAGRLVAQQAQLDWQLDTVEDRPLALRAQAAELRLGDQGLERLDLDLRGTSSRHALEISLAMPARPSDPLTGWLGLAESVGTHARVQAEGAWAKAPAGGGRWTGRVRKLAVGPWDGGELSRTPAGWAEAGDLQAELQIDGEGRLGTIAAEPGRIRLGEALQLRWDAFQVDLRPAAPHFALRADVEPFALAPLLDRLQPGFGWRGDLQLAARVEIKAADKVEAELVFERRSGDLQISDVLASQAFGLSELRVALSARDGLWDATLAFAGRSVGELGGVLRMRLPPTQRWPDGQASLEGGVEARVADIGIWNSWVPPGWRLSGSLQTSAQFGGRLGAPLYSGRMVGRELAVRNLLQGVDVRQGEVNVALEGARARVERFALRGGEGTLAVEGQALLGERPRLELALQAERFRVIGRIDRRLVASGRAQLQLSADQLQLQGDLRLDEGLFDLGRRDAPTLDDDVSVKRPGEEARPAGTNGAARPRRAQRVAVDVDLGDALVVRGRGLDTRLGGQIRLGSSAGRPTVHGIVRADGGTYAAYGQRLEIERGILSFSGPPESPSLDVLALRPNLDTQVGVAITGSLQSPRVRLHASTEMSDSEKLSWLVLGRAPDGLGRNDTALLQRAAVALWAGEGEAPTDALLRTLGLDEVSFRQGDGEVRETVITLGKQLGRRWYLGYERGVNSTTGTWQLIYRIAQRFTLRAQSGHENSLDVIWVWRFGEPLAAPVPKSAASAPP